jgi:hypothetical protein
VIPQLIVVVNNSKQRAEPQVLTTTPSPWRDLQPDICLSFERKHFYAVTLRYGLRQRNSRQIDDLRMLAKSAKFDVSLQGHMFRIQSAPPNGRPTVFWRPRILLPLVQSNAKPQEDRPQNYSFSSGYLCKRQVCYVRI